MQIFVILPGYNEAKRIGGILSSLKKSKIPFIVVDDGSKDKTFAVASRYTPYVYRHSINLGKGAALKTGCEAAIKLGADGFVIMDADGQHKVEDLESFLKILRSKKYDIVFGSRNMGLNMPLVRFLGNKFASILISVLFNIYVSDLICGFRAFTKNAYKKIKWESRGYGIETEMIIKTGKAGLRHCEVPVETVYYDRFKGVTILDAFSILIDVFKWRLAR
jgi:glycosyltransferase involved in cell wall biosynthesis